MKTESIRVDAKIKAKVKRHIKKSKQSIGGFYDLAAQEKIDKDLFLAQTFPPNQEMWVKEMGLK